MSAEPCGCPYWFLMFRPETLGVQRVVRHLWRMCFGLFIATGSFFLGQGDKVFPEFVLKTNVFSIPAILPLILLIVWIIRVRFTGACKKMSMPRRGDVYYAPSSRQRAAPPAMPASAP